MKNSMLLFLICLSAWTQHRRIDPPAAQESGMPYLVSGAEGAVYLSYIDYLGTEGHALRFTRWTGGKWTQPESIAQGKNWFVNWADYPTISAQPDGTVLAHWLTRNGTGNKYGYGIRVARRDAKSGVWREIHGMSLDEPKDYAGFLSFAPNLPGAIYLAPPKPADEGEGHRKTVRFVSFNSKGEAIRDVELDSDACSCCQTTVGATRDGFVAAYRDHLPGEIRDISIVRFADGVWTKPKTLHPDGWKINGCPTDGPSIATQDNQAGIVWLTRAQDKPRIQFAVSKDGGTNFGPPTRIDDGNPLGRASLTILDSKHYLAVWIEKTDAEGNAEIRLRRISMDGKLSHSVVVAATTTGRNGGFPKLAISGKHAVVGWRDGTVKVAQVEIERLQEMVAK